MSSQWPAISNFPTRHYSPIYRALANNKPLSPVIQFVQLSPNHPSFPGEVSQDDMVVIFFIFSIVLTELVDLWLPESPFQYLPILLVIVSLFYMQFYSIFVNSIYPSYVVPWQLLRHSLCRELLMDCLELPVPHIRVNLLAFIPWYMESPNSETSCL